MHSILSSGTTGIILKQYWIKNPYIYCSQVLRYYRHKMPNNTLSMGDILVNTITIYYCSKRCRNIIVASDTPIIYIYYTIASDTR